MTAAFRGGFTFKVGDGAGSESFTAIEEANEFSGFGKTNPLSDATSFDSTAREYIAGLSDGSEFTLGCLRVHAESSQQDVVIGKVDSGSTFNVQLAWTDGTNAKTYSFAVVGVGYVITPQIDEPTTISYTLKISGAITVS